MTIEVRIENRDKDKAIEVQHIEFNKAERSAVGGEIARIEPGEARTFHVHLLRDLSVREVKP